MCFSIKKLIESPVVTPEVGVREIMETYLSDLEQDTEDKRQSRGNRVNSKYFKLNPKTHTASFQSTDPGGSGKQWQQDLRFPEFTQIGRYQKDFEGTQEKMELAIKAGDVLVFCNCPDFLYQGYKFMGHISDWGIRKETRPPEVNNPSLDGSVCKHLYSVLDDIDKYIPKITADFDKAKDKNFRVIRR